MYPRRFGTDDVFDAIERMIEDLQRDMERSFKELQSFDEQSKPLIYGFTMSIGRDGEPVIKTFGDKEIGTGFREPVYDQFVKNDAGEVTVTIEMPGVSNEDIELSLAENSLSVSTPNSEKKYRCVIDLKVPIDPTSAKATYKNGILNVTMRVKGKSNKGIKISVE